MFTRALSAAVPLLLLTSIAWVVPRPALDAATTGALVEALADERRAQDTYRAIMDRFGEVRPFINVYRAEVQHERELLFLFDRYGIAVPARQDLRARVAVPDTLAAACALGVESEKVTVALYDRLLTFVEEPEVRQVFGWLREVSLPHHQPAFARCADRAQGGRGRRR